MNLYAYCLSDEVTMDEIARAPGVQGAEARLIEYESIKAVVTDFSGERAPLSRENVFAHEKMIHRVLARATPLPFRFGMVSDASRLESYVRAHEGAIKAGLARVRGAIEMSVKIIWDAEAVKRAAMEPAPADQITNKPAGPGTAFLAAKRRQVAGDEALSRHAGEIAGWLETLVSEAVRESSVRVCPTSGMALAAAHLVERARLERYRALIAQARSERNDLRFLTSGAWPPYSFCDLNV